MILSVSFHFPFSLFSKMIYFISLKGPQRETRIDGQKNVFYLLDHSLNDHNSCSWIRPMLGAWNSSLVSHIGWHLLLISQAHYQETRSEVKPPRLSTPMGYQFHTWQLKAAKPQCWSLKYSPFSPPLSHLSCCRTSHWGAAQKGNWKTYLPRFWSRRKSFTAMVVMRFLNLCKDLYYWIFQVSFCF